MFIDYSEGQYPDGTFYGRVDPLQYFDVVTRIDVIPGASGEAATADKPLLIPGINDLYA
jgi:hypothetical protein